MGPLSGFDFSYISRATNLTTLLLDATGLSSIKGIGKAAQLKKLNLRFNNLKGNLPIELRKLESLHFLSLSNNMFEGPLPDIFEDMEDLEVLLLEHNRFSGELSTFTLPKKLNLLDLSDNEFSGPIEVSFLSKFPSNEQLEIDLSDNMLTGTVPSTFARFERINLLLKGNFIVGVSPELCVKTLWNEGDVGVYGCDGILCPSKSWAPMGRSTKTQICEMCHSANYYGSATCISTGALTKGASDAMSRFKASYITLFLSSAILTSLLFF